MLSDCQSMRVCLRLSVYNRNRGAEVERINRLREMNGTGQVDCHSISATCLPRRERYGRNRCFAPVPSLGLLDDDLIFPDVH